MEKECYFCHRTLDQCKEYVDSLKKEYMDKMSGKMGNDDLKKVSENFDEICKYGMSSAPISSVNGEKGPVGIFVPICPICEHYMRSITNDIYGSIYDLENKIQ